jgi:hypothetical protein
MSETQHLDGMSGDGMSEIQHLERSVLAACGLCHLTCLHRHYQGPKYCWLGCKSSVKTSMPDI